MEYRDGGINLVSEAVKVTPPAAIATAHFMGYALSDWLLVASLIYTLFLLFVLIRDKIYVPYMRRKHFVKENCEACGKRKTK